MTNQVNGISEQKSVWGKKLLGGYAGLEHTSKQISQHIPKCIVYCEPFAGLGRISKYVTSDKKVLNDMSDYAVNYLRKNFPMAITEQTDFMTCIRKHDSKDTFFLIDPPWRFDCYNENNLSFCDRPVKQYYEELLNVFETIKGNWILCSSADEHETKGILKKSKWHNITVQSTKKVIFGKYARTLLLSNMPFKKDNSLEVFFK